MGSPEFYEKYPSFVDSIYQALDECNQRNFLIEKRNWQMIDALYAEEEGTAEPVKMSRKKF